MFTQKANLALLKGLVTKKSPIYVQYAVTGACNLNCRMCSSPESRKNDKELNLSQIEKLSEVLEKLKVGIIVLTGGEPFLRDDLPEIIMKFRKRGFSVRLQTNGILATEEKIKEVIKAGVQGVTVSLDSLYPERQKEIDGMDCSWHERIRAISLFSKLLPTKGPILGINTVISRYNLTEVPKIVDFATKIGFYSSLIPVHVSLNGKAFVIRKDASDFDFRAEDYANIDKIYARIIRMKKEGYNVYNSHRFLQESPDYLKYRRLYWKCDSPDLYFSVNPSGYFQPCIDINTHISILDDDFIYKFHSTEFRNYIKDKIKKCEGCFYACWPEISYLCRDKAVFFERSLLGLKISLSVRKPVQYEESLKLIDQINESYFNEA